MVSARISKLVPVTLLIMAFTILFAASGNAASGPDSGPRAKSAGTVRCSDLVFTNRYRGRTYRDRVRSIRATNVSCSYGKRALLGHMTGKSRQISVPYGVPPNRLGTWLCYGPHTGGVVCTRSRGTQSISGNYG